MRELLTDSLLNQEETKKLRKGSLTFGSPTELVNPVTLKSAIIWQGKIRPTLDGIKSNQLTSPLSLNSVPS